MIIRICEFSDPFAENKDTARDLRENKIYPALTGSKEEIVIDFSSIDSSTQSFIHALISEIFQSNGETVLERIAFRNCNKAIKSLITTVINYSLE